VSNVKPWAEVPVCPCCLAEDEIPDEALEPGRFHSRTCPECDASYEVEVEYETWFRTRLRRDSKVSE